MPNRKVFYSTLNRHERCVRENLFGKGSHRQLAENELLSIENLIAIRFDRIFIYAIILNHQININFSFRREWDQYLSKSNDRQKSIPLHWVEPNQNPNEEWSKFVKK